MCSVLGPELTSERMVSTILYNDRVFISSQLQVLKCSCFSCLSDKMNIILCTLQLPVFFKLCQDGVWGVRKVCSF